MIAAGGRLRLDAIVLPSGKNQETSFGARVLDGRAHQRVDQLLQHDLTRYRFGHLDHGRQIEMLDWMSGSSRSHRRSTLGSDLRIELLELSNLGIRSPAEIAVAGIAQVGRCNRLEAARRVKAAGPLVGDRLIVDKAVRVRRMHGFLIEVLRVEHAAFNPGDFRTNDRCAALKGDRVMLGPHFELLVVTDQSLEVLPPLVARGDLTGCSMRQRTVKLKVGGFEVCRRAATGAVARSAQRQRQMSGPRQEIAPATCGPNSEIREAPRLGSLARWRSVSRSLYPS